MSQEPVCHFKTIYWHASDFLPTVLVHLRRTVFKWILSKLAILTYFLCIWSFRHVQSWQFWHILCLFDRFDMPKAGHFDIFCVYLIVSTCPKLSILTYFVCIWSFRHAQSIICLSVLEYSKQACTCAHTHNFSLGNSVSRVDCAFNVLLSNMSSNLATVKTAFYNNHRLSWFWRYVLIREERMRTDVKGSKSCARRNTAIILRIISFLINVISSHRPKM